MIEAGLAAAEFTINGVPVYELTPWGVILLMVVGFMRGWVYPRQTVMDEREDKRYYRETVEVLSQQVVELLEQGRTVEALLKPISERASRDSL
jgi:hypothetical protein